MIALAEILKTHPRPWRYVGGKPGEVVMLDAANNRVELFTMLDFCVQVTTAMAQAAAQQSAQAQPETAPATEGAV